MDITLQKGIIHMTKLVKTFFISFVLFFCFCITNLAAAHMPVTLYTDQNKAINPRTGANMTEPYSPRNTCGSCHDYEEISKGYHFQNTGNWSLLNFEQLAAKNNDDEVEIDCLLCHSPNYNFQGRLDQIEKGNLQFAATVGANLGTVSGSIKEGEEPTVSYDEDIFTSRGTVQFEIISPTNDNCLMCHGTSSLQKTGSTWNDEENPDIHSMGDLNCLDCHYIINTENTPAINHQIATGRAAKGAAEEFKNTMLACNDCHAKGEFGAPKPKHTDIKISHLEYISCEGCHIPYINSEAIFVVDASTGKITLISLGELNNENNDEKIRAQLERFDDGFIYPVNNIKGIWWGNRNADGKIEPLLLSEVSSIFENIDISMPVNTENDISLALKTIREQLEGNSRFEQIQPVLVKGNKVYELSSDGMLQSDETTKYNEIYIKGHNVVPKEYAYGAGGCSDCHSPDSHWLAGQILQEPYGPGGEPIFVSQGETLGLNRTIMVVYSLYQRNIRNLIFIGLVGAFIFTVAHYLIIGPKGRHLGKLPRTMVRYTSLERISHFVRMFATIALIITGIGFALNALGILALGGGYYPSRTIHIILGFLFIISTLTATTVWYRSALLKPYDIEWFKKLGGYFTKKDCRVPAGRFNAGQKIFYWISGILSFIIAVTGIVLIFRSHVSGNWLVLAAVIHGLSAIALIAAVIVHAYLGSAANPGTWKVLLDGKVAEEWCKEHHPQWEPEETTEEVETEKKRKRSKLVTE